MLCSLAQAGGVDVLRIDDPVGWWERNGYVGMVPSIHLPTTHSGDDLIHVWLRIPEGTLIDARYLPDQERWCLVLPRGTRGDRAEYYQVSGREGGEATHYLDSPSTGEADWTLADVRGTWARDDGTQEFRVLRPVDGSVHAPLAGRSWTRGDGQAQDRATERLLSHAAKARRPVDRAPMEESGLDSLRRLNDCNGCHQRKMDRVTFERQGAERAMQRATDNLGFFVLTAVMSDDCVAANHRPEDLNAEDPYVEVRCGDEPAELTVDDGYERYTCPDGRVPIGYRDVRAALAANHPYTRRMCESRLWLAERMTERARSAYSGPIAACREGLSR